MSGKPSGSGFGSKGPGPPRQHVFDIKLSQPYEVYMSNSNVEMGLKKGTLVQGTITISYLNHSLAFVSNPSGGPDFLIDGQINRNRALNGDLVVVELLDCVETKCQEVTLSTASNQSTVFTDCKENLKIAGSSECRDPGQSSDLGPHATSEGGSSHSSDSTQVLTPDVRSILPVDTTNPADVTEQLASLELKDDTSAGDTSAGDTSTGDTSTGGFVRETLVDRLYKDTGRDVLQEASKEKQRKAKVVYIAKKVNSRSCIGTIKAFHKQRKLALFCPRDPRFPRMVIPLNQFPRDLPVAFKKYQAVNFLSRLKDWQINEVFPSGFLVRTVSDVGDIEGETESILLDNDIEYEEFSKEVNACIPQDPSWKIPEKEEQRRRDFRKECVFTVDPETARDLDDALHVKRLDKVGYEVGVHIADVSYFVKPDTALDKVASQRATSTYLVHKVIPMLPRQLCENLCSLNPNEDKLSFSVVWQLTSEGEFISQWIGRSIIKSCCKLSYGHAQDMIDGTWSDEALPPITGGFQASQVAEAVVILNNLAKTLKKLRQSKGTLRLDQPKLHYVLDESTGMPTGCEIYPIRESNKMIEEFMLLANMSVARCISEAFPDRAMLRRHPPPRPAALEELVQKCFSLGLPLDASSAAAIQQSLDQCTGRNGQVSLSDLDKLAFIIMCVKVMELAVYFCAGAQSKVSPHHYALNVPLYTHFTSPIRRYADVIVHRQLADALGEGPDFTATCDEIEAQAVQCNKKKKAAKNAGDQSVDMFFSLMLKETGPQPFEGVVIAIQNKSFDVLVVKYGFVRTVYCNELQLKSFEVVAGEGGANELKLVWNTEDGASSNEQVIKVFSEVEVMLSAVPRDILKNKVWQKCYD